MTDWRWVWPGSGSAPVTHNTDSEMFDRTDVPYSETVVREAIQNTLDARLDQSRPASIHFRFHESDTGATASVLREAMDHRIEAGLSVPNDWNDRKITWLTIEDFNTTGLKGDLHDREGDFWGFWLNFGVTNKQATGRGGRGIGRVVFLIASRIQTVVGMTRRHEDGRSAVCGMTILKPGKTSRGYKTTHAYLAEREDEDKSIFHLHSGEKVLSEITDAFRFSGYGDDLHGSGLALAIPFPHEELERNGILASVVEHFAPAILMKELIVRVDDDTLDRESIRIVSHDCSDKFRTGWIKQNPARYLDLLDRNLEKPEIVVEVDSRKSKRLKAVYESEEAVDLRDAIEKGESVHFTVSFELSKRDRHVPVNLRCVSAKTPEDAESIDRFFREGMSLPDVKAKNSGELDVLIFVDAGELASYLNLCEGKAHLDLLRSKEIKERLDKAGFKPPLQTRDFVRSLPTEIRALLARNIEEPTPDVFARFFSIPKSGGQRGGSGPNPDKSPVPPIISPSSRIQAFETKTLRDGFQLRANSEFDEWPLEVKVKIAYADGTRKPKWSRFDFDLNDLQVEKQGCDVRFEENVLVADHCNEDFKLIVTGFDSKREIDAQFKYSRSKQDA